MDIGTKNEWVNRIAYNDNEIGKYIEITMNTSLK